MASTIDPNTIDITKPVEIVPSSASVRANEAATKANFQAAKTDIEAIQAVLLSSTPYTAAFLLSDDEAEAQAYLDVPGLSVDNAFTGAQTITGFTKIIEGTSSGATAQSTADSLVVDSNGNTGVSILSGDASLARLAFGNLADNLAFDVNWDNGANLATIGTDKAAAELRFRTGSAVEVMRLTDLRRCSIGTKSDPQSTLHVAAGGVEQLRIESTNTPSGSIAPSLNIYRSGGPSASGNIGGQLEFQMQNTSGIRVAFARYFAEALNATAGNEFGGVSVQTYNGGALLSNHFIRQGIYMQGATGGDPGAGKLNAVDLLINGVTVCHPLAYMLDGEVTTEQWDAQLKDIELEEEFQGNPLLGRKRKIKQRARAVRRFKKRIEKGENPLDFHWQLNHVETKRHLSPFQNPNNATGTLSLGHAFESLAEMDELNFIYIKQLHERIDDLEARVRHLEP